MLDDGTGQPPLDPSVMAYLQGAPPQQAPAPQQIQLPPEYGLLQTTLNPPPPPPPPPPPQQIGAGQGTGVNGDEVANAYQDPFPSVTGGGGLHPDVANAIANGFQPPPELPSGMPAQTSPDFQLTPKQAAPIQKADAAADAAYVKAQGVQAKQQAQAAAYAATPEGQQQTAFNQQQAANADQQANVLAEGDLAKKQADEEAATKQRALVEEQALVAKQQQEREQRLVQQQSLFTDYQKSVEVAAKKTVDPNRYWNDKSTGGQIAAIMGIILSGLGNGMSGNGSAPNQAAAMLNQAIDRDIEAQKADLGQANAVVGMRQNSFNDYHSLMGNADDAATLKKAEARTLVASQLEATAAKYKGANQQLLAQDAAAKLRAQSASELMDLAGKRVAQAHQAAELANQKRATDIAGGHLALAGKQFAYEQKKDDRDFGEKQREWDTGIAEKLATAKATGNVTAQAQLTDLRKYGLRDPTTGDVLLTPKGEKMKAQADQMEVQARGLPQAQADAVRAQAQAIREQAENSEHIESEDAHGESGIQAALNNAQDVVDTVADIKAQLAKDPGMTDRKAWASLAGNYANAKEHAIKSFGANPSSREMEAFSENMGPNGDKLFDREFSKDKMVAQLETLDKTIRSDADVKLRGAGYKGSFKIQAHNGESLAPIAADKTSVEAGEDAQLGGVGNQIAKRLSFTGRDNNDRQLQAENSSDTGPTGLPKQDTVNVSHLVTSYDKATDAQRAKILTELTAYANSPREAVFNSIVPIIRDNPEVFAKVVSTLPPERQEALQKIYSGIPAVRTLPTGKKFVTPPFGGSRTD